MPSDLALKILIAMNAVQIFITLLLVSTLASAAITTKSGAASSPMASPAAAGAWPAPDPANNPPPQAAAEAPPAGALPPAGDPPPAVDAAPAAPAVDAAPVARAAADPARTTLILRTYLNLVSKRLEMAAGDAKVDPSPWLPAGDAIEKAVATGDASSAEFTAILDTLREGYTKLGMELPSPPAARKAEGTP